MESVSGGIQNVSKKATCRLGACQNNFVILMYENFYIVHWFDQFR